MSQTRSKNAIMPESVEFVNVMRCAMVVAQAKLGGSDSGVQYAPAQQICFGIFDPPKEDPDNIGHG